jgi:alginate O-acetyltransferase complex protein AlgI
MPLQSLHFLVFLVSVFALNRLLLARPDARKNMLLAASYYFYSCWDWRFLGLVLLMTVVNFSAGRAIAASTTRRGKRLWLILALVLCLGTLAYFKYESELVASTAQLLEAAGVEADLATLRILLPIGISFYTFQALSYTLDIYRGHSKPTTSFRDFALFVAFFPTVLSGPITRATQLLPQLERPLPDSVERAEEGLVLMMRGFVKKIAFADVLAEQLVNPAFAAPENYSALFLLVALYAYSFQIYMDLSGYTDIVRGAAKLLGFELPENFNRPYLATSVSDYWQRWHISMSSFFRDYVYFSMGGSKYGNVYINLYVTFVAIGLWHRSSLNMVVYGLIHGTFVCIERWRRRRRTTRGQPTAPQGRLACITSVFVTFQIVAFARILFRSADLSSATDYLTAMLQPVTDAAPFSILGVAVLAAAIVFHYVPGSFFTAVAARYSRMNVVAQGAILVAVAFALLSICFDSGQFVYFQY